MGYRILSMDGGGSWALIEVRALIELYSEATTGHEVLADFDMVVGNSGGSEVLAGLVENLTLKDLLGNFESDAMRRSLFFPTPKWYFRLLNLLIGVGPLYSTEHKLMELQKHLPKTGGLTLAQAAKGLGRGAAQGTDIHLMIIGFDYDANRAAFFRSSPTSGPGWGEGDQATATLAESVHASTNAPVNYFDGPAVLPSGGRFWDGAITGCNNPVLAGVTEAIGRKQPAKEIVALSIGTGTVALRHQSAGRPKPHRAHESHDQPGRWRRCLAPAGVARHAGVHRHGQSPGRRHRPGPGRQDHQLQQALDRGRRAQPADPRGHQDADPGTWGRAVQAGRRHVAGPEEFLLEHSPSS